MVAHCELTITNSVNLIIHSDISQIATPDRAVASSNLTGLNFFFGLELPPFHFLTSSPSHLPAVSSLKNDSPRCFRFTFADCYPSAPLKTKAL